MLYKNDIVRITSIPNHSNYILNQTGIIKDINYHLNRVLFQPINESYTHFWINMKFLNKIKL